MAEYITPPLVNIINSSINKEFFLDSWNMSRVFPVPKIDNPISEKDFWSISILTVLSKIQGKVILKRLSDYIVRKSIYKLTKSGFRKEHLTQTIPLKFRENTQKVFFKKTKLPCLCSLTILNPLMRSNIRHS